MYSLISAKSKKTNTKQWEDIDISNINVVDLFLDYLKVLVLVNVPGSTEPEVMDLDQLKGEFGGYPDTLSQLFIDIDDKALITSAGTLDIEKKYVKYADAFRAGYKIIPVTQTGSDDIILPKEDKTWLKLTKEDLDYGLFQDHALTLVNGFLHFSETSNQGIFIKDGMKSNFICQASTCGIMSFKDIGTISTKLITLDMIKELGSLPLYKKTIIDVDEDLTDKTVLLSIGGYLVLPNTRVFRSHSESTLLIDFNNYSLINRYFESSKYLDFSEFDLTEFATNDNQVNVDEILNDDYIKNLLTMSQSFIIIVDNKDVVFNTEFIRKNRLPHSYTSYEVPLYPILTGEGMFANYWYKRDKPYWSIQTIDGFLHNRNYNTNKPKTQGGVDDKRVSFNPVNYSRACYIKIATEIFI